MRAKGVINYRTHYQRHHESNKRTQGRTSKVKASMAKAKGKQSYQ